MIYLILAIVCSASIALIFKYSESHNLNRYAITSANYVAAFSVSLYMVLAKKLFILDYTHILSSFKEELPSVIRGASSFGEGPSFIWAVLMGCVAGIFFFLSLIYYQKNVRENGVGLSGAFGKMGILVPMIFSIILWKEIPGIIQWIGIIIALFSILLVNLSFEKGEKLQIKASLLSLMLIGGIADFSNKIFQKYALLQYKELFLFFVFFTAFIISVVFTWKQGKKITGRDILTGLIVGIPNLFSSYFLILALNHMYSSIAFPIFSAGSILLINLGGFVIFKEKLKKKEIAAILLIIAALVLINL